MQFDDVRPFLQRHHRGVITTYQPNGAAHASVVVCGAYEGQAAFVIVRGTSVKARNLRRDPRCTVLAVTTDWRSWVSVEGQAQLFDYRNTEGEKLRVMLRDVFRACPSSSMSCASSVERPAISTSGALRRPASSSILTS